MEKRSQWRFDTSPAGWSWAVMYPDGSTAASTQRWATLKDCVSDAALHGYVVWSPEEERRHEQRLKVAEALKRDG